MYRGYFAAKNAFSQLTPSQRSETVAIVIGCGPVGLCALIAATSFNPRKIFAIDSVPSRLDIARSLGAEPLNHVIDKEVLKQRILDATEGRGADVVLEIVGNSPALKMAYDIIRPWGIISSVGVHNAEVRKFLCQTNFQAISEDMNCRRH
jgi:threonine dehydrogenase-like Zn-dependent dehydrogenase